MKYRTIPLALCLAATLSACGADTRTQTESTDPAQITTATVHVENGEYQLSWVSDIADVPVDVHVSTLPTGADSILILDDAAQTDFVWTAESDENTRHYFTITPEGGEPYMVATRLLPLEGGRNFRDLGGYETDSGERVKWGLVYRSGVMHKLTENDYEYLSDLGIQVLCDLRTTDERSHEPTVWAAGEIDYRTFPDPVQEQDANPLVQVFTDPDVTPEDVTAMMSSLYHGILEQQKTAYEVMFDELANGKLPLTFNCSAGKDRTGVGAALILSALGVKRDQIVADYALSEQLVDYEAEFTAESDGEEDGGAYAYLRQLPPELLRPLMRSDPAYIEATFAYIEDNHGNVINFIQSELNVDDEDLERIRARLLES